MTDDVPDRPPSEVIEDDDWFYRRLALNHFRSDGTVNPTAFMRNSVPPIGIARYADGPPMQPGLGA